LFASENAVSAYENRELGYMDEIMFEELRQEIKPVQNLSTFDKSLHYLNENRWSFIGK
jgi:hypothetical protein